MESTRYKGPGRGRTGGGQSAKQRTFGRGGEQALSCSIIFVARLDANTAHRACWRGRAAAGAGRSPSRTAVAVRSAGASQRAACSPAMKARQRAGSPARPSPTRRSAPATPPWRRARRDEATPDPTRRARSTRGSWRGPTAWGTLLRAAVGWHGLPGRWWCAPPWRDGWWWVATRRARRPAGRRRRARRRRSLPAATSCARRAGGWVWRPTEEYEGAYPRRPYLDLSSQ